MPGEVLRLKPEQLKEILKSEPGGIAKKDAVSLEQQRRSVLMIEHAKEILGKDFLGVEAVRNMEQKLKAIGVDVEFILDILPPFPYGERDLQIARQNDEMLVLRPEYVLQAGATSALPLTIIGLRDIFRKDPLEKLPTLFLQDDWYKEENFATSAGEMKLGWKLVKRGILADSNGRNRDDQFALLQQYAQKLQGMGAETTITRRRTALEAVYDLLLYYVNTGERLLPDRYDWTSSCKSNGYPVVVGTFNTFHLNVAHWSSGSAHLGGTASSSAVNLVGVCPSR